MACVKSIRINEEFCDGCGACARACVDGVLQVIDGKARLVAEVCCYGCGICMSACVEGALQVVDLESKAVTEVCRSACQGKRPKAAFNIEEQRAKMVKSFTSRVTKGPVKTQRVRLEKKDATYLSVNISQPSELSHWPVQLMLVPVGAPFLRECCLLVCADCVPFAVPDFHSRYLDGHSVLVGCPKLDDLELYRMKLKDILERCSPHSIAVARMEVPCCSGIVQSVIDARDEKSPSLPVEILTIGIRGGFHQGISAGKPTANKGGT